MATGNISQATTTDFANQVPDFIVDARALDAENDGGTETYWYFTEAKQNFGYYFEIPEIYSAANALATWSVGKGWDTEDASIKVQLGYVSGLGKDTFDQVMWNHEVTKLIVGDAFCEIVRNEGGGLLNLIPISPERVKVVINSKLTTKNQDHIRYEVWNGKKWKKIKKDDMLHSQNKRIGDQIHGTSQIDASKWIIDARNEALVDGRKIEHRGMALGIAYYKTSNEGKITYVNNQIELAVANGEMLGVPEDTVEIKDFPSKQIGDRQAWIQYLENFFYQVFGVPRSIASSDGTSEVGGKMGHVIFEPIYTKEQGDFEGDLWNQALIKIKFNRPPSLGGLVNETEQKNTGQTGIQPNDVTADMERE